jgi:glucose/arabinose dehydrogenase
VHSGEGGLLGIAVTDWSDQRWLYAYETTSGDNRIVRMTLDSQLNLGAPVVILEGIAKAGNHNGGRIAFGPDGMLYATVGDAANPGLAQDVNSLNGKILRMTPSGGVPDDNPFGDSYVYSMGHRNPQGIAWDADGQLWAAEFGQNTWDEFNRIEAGANYGWPIVEGIGGQSGFVDPVLQWATDDASPSGLTYIDGTFFLAALRGTRVWAIYPDGADGASAVAWFVGQFGRVRDVAPGPDGTLWFISNNTDGRGTPISGDDHLYQVRLVPLEEG